METIRAEEISQIISKQIRDYEKKLDISETGTVLSVGDGIARVYGVQNAMAMELLGFDLTDDQRIELAPKEITPPALVDTPAPIAPVVETAPVEPNPLEVQTAMRNWQHKALYALKKTGCASVEFVSSLISDTRAAEITDGLKTAQTVDEVKAIFDTPIDYHDQIARAVDWLESHAEVKAGVQPAPVINVTVNNPAQEPPIVNVTVAPAAVQVSVPEQPAAVVNVTMPEQPVAQVTVNVPEQPAANITVNVPKQPVPQVTVNVPEHKRKGAKIIRDGNGNIQGIEEVSNG